MTKRDELALGRLRDCVDEYFSVCDKANANSKKTVKPYTVSGLVSYIGISRSEFESLSHTRGQKRLVEYAKAKIEAFIEEKALTGELSCNASLNSLKYNFGWGDTKQGESGVSGGNITVTLSPDMCAMAK